MVSHYFALLKPFLEVLIFVFGCSVLRRVMEEKPSPTPAPLNKGNSASAEFQVLENKHERGGRELTGNYSIIFTIFGHD